MYSSCNTKWWIAWAWIWRHETTSKRKLAYEWPTAHMSKILIHNIVSFLFLYFVAWEFLSLTSYLSPKFLKRIEKPIISSISYEFLFCSAAINFAKSPHISSTRNGSRTRTDIPVQKIFSPHLLLHKPTWLSSRCGPAHFSTISEMLRNSNRIVISCIECLNVIPHGYFQRRCFLYVLYTIYDYDYSYDFM